MDEEEDDDVLRTKADEPVQSSFVSSDFTNKLLNLENPSPPDNEIASLMETSAPHAMTVPEITFGFTTTIPPPPSFFNPLPQQATPTPTPTTSEATTRGEKKSSSTSKDASQSQHKHSGKSAHAEEPSHTIDDSGVLLDQEFDMGNNDEQPTNKEVSKLTGSRNPNDLQLLILIGIRDNMLTPTPRPD
ncbi:hypothetical protein Tco_0110027 [Tanacetum coccineum]